MEHMCDSLKNTPYEIRLVIEPCENSSIMVDLSKYIGFDEAILKMPVTYCPWCGERLRDED